MSTIDRPCGKEAQDLRSLALTYLFLARALSNDEVPEGFLVSLKNQKAHLNCEIDAFVDQLDDANIPHWRTELAADHAACLLGMSANPVHPYESVYTSDARLMVQDAHDQVVQAYAEQGFATREGQHIPADHVALELEFMGELLKRAVTAPSAACILAPTAASQAMGAYEGFLRSHALKWMPQFCGDLERRASTPFYRGVAQMLQTLLQSEAERLGA